MIEIRQYVDRRGRNPFERWLDSLNNSTQARIVTLLDRLERGNLSSVKGVSEGVQELRADFGPGYRIYFAWDGHQLIILLGGGSKKRQQTDITTAKEMWREYKTRKREMK